jgi:hypothetical protein
MSFIQFDLARVPPGGVGGGINEETLSQRRIHTGNPDTRKLLSANRREKESLLCCGLVHQVQFFARLEPDRLARSNTDLCARPRVPPDARLPGLHREHAKPTQFNAITRNQSLLHAVEDRVHRVFRLGPRKSGPFHDPLDKVLFNQLGPPLSRNLDRSMFEVTHCPAVVMLGTKPKIVNASQPAVRFA